MQTGPSHPMLGLHEQGPLRVTPSLDPQMVSVRMISISRWSGCGPSPPFSSSGAPAPLNSPGRRRHLRLLRATVPRVIRPLRRLGTCVRRSERPWAQAETHRGRRGSLTAVVDDAALHVVCWFALCVDRITARDQTAHLAMPAKENQPQRVNANKKFS